MINAYVVHQKPLNISFLSVTYTLSKKNNYFQIPYQINTLILLSGCPLYDDAVNVEIFKLVQRFIIESGRFD